MTDASEVLVRYRVSGGPVRVDQRLSVLSDGTVELDERHRGREAIRLTIGSSELERVRSALDTAEPDRWPTGFGFTWQKLKGRLRDLLPYVQPRTHFELRRGRHATAWPDANLDPSVADLVETLDEIRVRAVQSQPR